MLASMFKSETFLGSIMLMIIVSQKISDHSEEGTDQLNAMKNAIFPFFNK